MAVDVVPSLYSASLDAAETASLQQLIDKAAAGSMVTLPSGSYADILVIDKPLTVIGHASGTIIAPTSAANSYAIWVRSEGVVLKDVMVCNDAPGLYTTGVKISAAGTEVYNCRFVDMPIGIAVWASDVVIAECRFIRCSDEGIALLGSELGACENTRIVSCSFYDNCDGVEGQFTVNTVIDRCYFGNSTHAGIDFIGASNVGVVIRNCTIENTRVFDLYFANAEDILLSDCVYDVDRVRFYNSADITISNSMAGVASASPDDPSSLIERITAFITQLWDVISARFPVLARLLENLRY